MSVVPPRVLGSTCFVHDLSPGHGNLSDRAVKCIFLRHSKVQIGYNTNNKKSTNFFLDKARSRRGIQKKKYK